MKLDGWKRIGIVASVVWAVGAYAHTFDVQSESDIHMSTILTESCIDANHGSDPGDKCSKEGDQELRDQYHYEVEDAALVALVPIPFGWGFVYLVLLTFRWIKRGFSRPMEDHADK
jgi:hypothetical protein